MISVQPFGGFAEGLPAFEDAMPVAGEPEEANKMPISQLERFDTRPGSRVRQLESMADDAAAPFGDTDPIIKHGNWIGFGLAAVALVGIFVVLALAR